MVIERLRKCHHPSLAEGNKGKLEVGSGVVGAGSMGAEVLTKQFVVYKIKKKKKKYSFFVFFLFRKFGNGATGKVSYKTV